MPRLGWRGAALVALIWLACLLFITVTLSNPVTFNLAQIRQADLICVGTFQDGTFQVKNCWPETDLELNHFENQEDITPAPKTQYIVPVTITRSGPEITLAPFDVPLIYPATEQTLEQLRALSSKL